MKETLERRTSATDKGLATRLASASLVVAALTSSWTGVELATNNLSDIAIAVCAAATVMSWLGGSRPLRVSVWMLAPTFAALLVLTHSVVVFGHPLQPEMIALQRLLLSTTLLAILITSEVDKQGVRAARRLLLAWALGGLVSSIVAVVVSSTGAELDFLVVPTGERVSGLTSHPNSLAMAASLSIPVAFYFASEASRTAERLACATLIGFSIAALFLANSRAGFIVGGAGASIALLAFLRQTRFRFLSLPLGLFVIAASTAWGPSIIEGTRLAPGAGEQSNQGRITFAEDALDLFASSPVFGAGFSEISGVAVPLQLLSAGGILLAVSYYGFAFGAARPSLANLSLPSGRAGLIVLLVVIAFGTLNNGYSERVTFWPILLLGMVSSFTVVQPQWAAPQSEFSGRMR